jgi:hypothetical protein
MRSKQHDGLDQQYQPPWPSLPLHYQQAKNYHVTLNPAEPNMALLQKLHEQTRRSGGVQGS